LAILHFIQLFWLLVQLLVTVTCGRVLLQVSAGANIAASSCSHSGFVQVLQMLPPQTTPDIMSQMTARPGISPASTVTLSAVPNIVSCSRPPMANSGGGRLSGFQQAFTRATITSMPAVSGPLHRLLSPLRLTSKTCSLSFSSSTPNLMSAATAGGASKHVLLDGSSGGQQHSSVMKIIVNSITVDYSMPGLSHGFVNLVHIDSCQNLGVEQCAAG